MVVVSVCETSVSLYKTARCNIPEESSEHFVSICWIVVKTASATSSAETENASQRSSGRSDLLLRFIWLTDERNAVQPACHKRALLPPTGDGVDTIIYFYLLGATTLIYWTGEGDSPLQLVSLAKVGYFHYHLFVVSSSVYLACTAANKCMHWAD
jgi:hypothetical protein